MKKKELSLPKVLASARSYLLQTIKHLKKQAFSTELMKWSVNLIGHMGDHKLVHCLREQEPNTMVH